MNEYHCIYESIQRTTMISLILYVTIILFWMLSDFVRCCLSFAFVVALLAKVSYIYVGLVIRILVDRIKFLFHAYFALINYEQVNNY